MPLAAESLVIDLILGLEAESYMKAGTLVPDATILKLILSE